MGKKVFGALLLILVIAVCLTLREEGAEHALGGAFAPLETVRSKTAKDPLGGLATGNSLPGVAQTDYKQLTDRVRERVNGAMRESEKRAGR